MNPLWLILGIAALCFLAVELLRTTLGSGDGIVDRISNRLLKSLLNLRRILPRHLIFPYAGLFYVSLNIIQWLVLLWFGWTCIFLASPDAITSSDGIIPPNLTDRIYFAGYAISTLGVGNYVPKDGFYQIATVVASLSGFLTISFVISFLSMMLDAALQRRRVAHYIHHLGETPRQLLLNHWTGEDFGPLAQHLSTLTQQIVNLEQSHRTHFALHRFYSNHRHEDLSLALSVLEEAFVFLKSRMPGSAPSGTDNLRRAIGGFTEASRSSLIIDVDTTEPPPPPNMDDLENKLPLTSEPHAEVYHNAEQQRALLCASVHSAGWKWEQVYQPVAIERN